MNTTIEPTAQLAAIVPALKDTVGRIDTAKLTNPTPCDEFTVHDVIDHMIVGGATFSYAFLGMTPPQLTAPAVYGRVPAAEFDESMDELLDAVRSPGALERTIESPFGPMPAEDFARFVAFDGLVHGWDLTVSTGVPFRVPAPVIDAVDAFARAAITDEMRDGQTFRAPTEPPVLGSTLDRLAAFSGRTVRAHAVTGP
jgi:uncharacterized protein (TIGR03086 family)